MGNFRPDNMDNNSTKARETRTNIVQYLQKNRGRPQYRPAPPAARAVAKIMRPLSKKHASGISGLRNNWPEIIGQRWAGLSEPIKITASREGKTLIIAAQGPAASLLEADSRQIIQKINQYLGQGAIYKIKIRQMAINKKQKKELSKSLEKPAKNHINKSKNNFEQSPNLKQALDKLKARIEK